MTVIGLGCYIDLLTPSLEVGVLALAKERSGRHATVVGRERDS